jgi:hypothetical protein
MSEEGNKNPRKMEGSAKELPLPLDLAGLAATVVMSSSWSPVDLCGPGR